MKKVQCHRIKKKKMRDLESKSNIEIVFANFNQIWCKIYTVNAVFLCVNANNTRAHELLLHLHIFKLIGLNLARISSNKLHSYLSSMNASIIPFAYRSRRSFLSNARCVVIHCFKLSRFFSVYVMFYVGIFAVDSQLVRLA